MPTSEVKKSEAGLTLLEFIQTVFPSGVSNKEIKRRIENGRASVNGSLALVASKKVLLKDLVEWNEAPLKKEKILFDPAQILFEDPFLLIFNKPSGIASEAKEIASFLKAFGKLFLVHRLDKHTSGVLVLAKNREVAEKLEEAFKKRKVEKTYLAFVDKVPVKKKGIIENSLGKIGSFQGQTVYGSVKGSLGKPAKTLYVVQKNYKKASLVRCYPVTGRTHQIRVHMSEMGHPIIGDHQYGKTGKVKSSRMLLHAYQLKIVHPMTLKPMQFTAPIPKDFQDIVKEVS